MTKKVGLKAVAFILMISLANQSFTLVDSSTEHHYPSLRNTWREVESDVCEPNLGEVDEVDLENINSNAETGGNVVDKEKPDYRNKQSDIEDMQAGGNYVSDWVETNGNVVNGTANPKPVFINGYEDFIEDTDIDTMQTGGNPSNW